MMARYGLGLLMFFVAAVFTLVLGNILQYRAITQQQAVIALHAEPVTASLLPPAVRKVSFSY
jgi:hypothetical protein